MTSPAPPRARKEPKTTVQLGRTRVDDYAWMKDDNWQAVLRDPHLIRADVKAHLEAENAYTAAMLASTEPLQGHLTAVNCTPHCSLGSNVAPRPGNGWKSDRDVACSTNSPRDKTNASLNRSATACANS